eukprot:1142190-Pelagomonas_calceolata.AAC.2
MASTFCEGQCCSAACRCKHVQYFEALTLEIIQAVEFAYARKGKKRTCPSPTTSEVNMKEH